MDYLPYLYYIGRVKGYRILHSSLFTFLFPLNFTVFLNTSDYQLVTCYYMVLVSIYGVHKNQT